MEEQYYIVYIRRENYHARRREMILPTSTVALPMLLTTVTVSENR